MSQLPRCRRCATDYQAYSEQQVGFDYNILIKIWICPECKHRKSAYTENDLECWENAAKYVPEKVQNRNFD